MVSQLKKKATKSVEKKAVQYVIGVTWRMV